jgi:hypothetical protein
VRHVLRRRHLKRVIVTLKSGASFSGVVWDHDSQALVLRNATALGQGERGVDVTVDGELIVLTADVEFMQRP